MSRPSSQWLVAYDIRSPRRLRHVHAFLAKRALSVQYSVYVLPANVSEIGDTADDLRMLIDERKDDVRIYHLPQRCLCWLFGERAMFPEGLWLDAPGAFRRLLQRPER